jgi:hypothetical protein
VAIDTLGFETLDGCWLEGDLDVADLGAGALVMCHPHPLYGGNRHHHVVDAVCRAGARAGLTTLRFDFRGVGASTGRHDGAGGERLDVLAALELVEPLAGSGPLITAGYSFGAMTALDVAHPATTAWLAIAPPVPMMSAPPVAAFDPRPTYCLVPAHDQYSPPEVTAAVVSAWSATTLEVIESADHFLAGQAGDIEAAVAAWLSGFSAPGAR